MYDELEPALAIAASMTNEHGEKPHTPERKYDEGEAVFQ